MPRVSPEVDGGKRRVISRIPIAHREDDINALADTELFIKRHDAAIDVA